MITFPYKKFNPFIQLDWHDGIFLNPPTPVPVTGSAAHIAAGILAMPWIGLGSNKNNGDTILADGMPIVSEGHQPGLALIPHLNLFPFTPVQLNLMIPFLILTSTNTCAMSAGSVVGPDGPISVAIFRYVGLNQGCCDAGAQTKIPIKGAKAIPKGVPIAFALIPNSTVVNWGTVHVGFTLGDLVRFLASTLLDFAVQKIFDKFFKKFQDMFRVRMRPSIDEMLPPDFLKNTFKNTLRRMGLPNVGRAANGQFMSIGQAMADQTHSILNGPFNSMLDGVGFPGDVQVLDLNKPLQDAASATTEHLSLWADGKAELIP